MPRDTRKRTDATVPKNSNKLPRLEIKYLWENGSKDFDYDTRIKQFTWAIILLLIILLGTFVFIIQLKTQNENLWNVAYLNYELRKEAENDCAAQIVRVRAETVRDCIASNKFTIGIVKIENDTTKPGCCYPTNCPQAINNPTTCDCEYQLYCEGDK